VNKDLPPKGGIHTARKRFGQHFLESAWADKVADACAPSPDDTFLEIGPGPGALTLRLAPRVRRLIAIEVDRDLAAALRRQTPANTEIVEADFLDTDLAPYLSSGPVRVAGNLPYNISSPILFKLLETASRHPALVDATVMLQEEVAERLIADVGTAEYGVLTILTSLGAEVTRVLSLPPGAFRPMPKVRSSVVRLRFRPAELAPHDRPLLERIVRSIFTQRRKVLSNALRPLAESLQADAKAALAAAAIDPVRRPETLTLADLARLTKALAGAGREP
jgi:16S rRNA (adenine1518-N6/adenine1519-N6)-dimethyltransferase